MSNTKHTPSPWYWDGDPTNYDKDEEALRQREKY